MSNIRVTSLDACKAVEIQGTTSRLRKPLQKPLEANVETLLQIPLLASAYTTDYSPNSRADPLGLHEDRHPVTRTLRIRLRPSLRTPASGSALSRSTVRHQRGIGVRDQLNPHHDNPQRNPELG